MQRDILIIAQNVRNLYTQSAFTGAGEITPVLVSAGAFPADLALQSTTDPNWGVANRPMHPWGSYMSVYSITSGTFRISFYGVSTSVCANLATAVATQNGVSGPVAVGSWFTAPPVGSSPGAGYGASNNVTLQTGTPFTFTQAVAMCGGSPTDPSVSGSTSVEFDFSLN